MPLAASASAGSLLQTILALSFVLALLIGMAWFMKRYGPKTAGNGATLRVLGSLSLGGRERVMLIEAAGQWIVVGAAPGRVNLLCTLERQPDAQPDAQLAVPQNGVAAGTFAEWLRQTIEKRNGK
jgi:flagellar protein FliO/FliZ